MFFPYGLSRMLFLNLQPGIQSSQSQIEGKRRMKNEKYLRNFLKKLFSQLPSLYSKILNIIEAALRLSSKELLCLNQSSASASRYIINSFYKWLSYILKQIILWDSIPTAALFRNLTLISSICHFCSQCPQRWTVLFSLFKVYWHIYSKQPYAPSIFIFIGSASQVFLYDRFMVLHLSYPEESRFEKLFSCITFS